MSICFAIALLVSFLAGGFKGASIYAFLTISLRANQENVTGLTLTIFGFWEFLWRIYRTESRWLCAVSEVTKNAFSNCIFRYYRIIPVLGKLFFQYNWVVYFGYRSCDHFRMDLQQIEDWIEFASMERDPAMRMRQESPSQNINISLRS